MAAGKYDLAALSVAFKTVYDPKIRNIIDEESYFLSMIEKGDVEAFKGGLGLEWLVKVTPNTSYGIGLEDGGILPAPGRRTEVRAKTDVIDHWSSTELTEAAIRRASGGEAAFYSVLETSKTEIVTDLRKKVDTSLYKTPLFVVTANSAGTTVTLSSVQYIQPGDVLEIGNKADGTSSALRSVVSKDHATNTIVINSAITVTSAASGAWYPGAGPAAPKKIESLALAAGVNRTLHNIDSTTIHGWNGNTLDLAGGIADEGDFGFLKDQISERGQGKVTDAITTTGIVRRFANQMVSAKRFTNAEAVTLRGGFSALFIDEIPVVAQSDVPKGHLFAFDRKAMTELKGESGFITVPGSDTIWRQTIDQATGRYKTSFEASYGVTLNVIYNTPGAVGSLTSCQDDKPPADM